MTADEFIAYQSAQAETLRLAILDDPAADRTLLALAADADDWQALFMQSLDDAGLLRADDTPPPPRENGLAISQLATLGSGILIGPSGDQIIADGNLVEFFDSVRRWYGHDEAIRGSAPLPDFSTLDLSSELGLTYPTSTTGFNIYVPYGECTLLPELSGTRTPIEFGRFFDGVAGESRAAISGPVGMGPEQFVPASSDLPYTIEFENAPGNNATASEIRVVTELDDALDPRTFTLGDIQLGEIMISVPPESASIQQDFDFTTSRGFVLRVSAGIDQSQATASWLLQAIDPLTGELLNDVDKGILPPQTISDDGGGFVSYSVRPKSAATTGQVIRASARILTDIAPPQDTSVASNVLDAVAPTTQLTATTIGVDSGNFELSWASVDDPVGSGVGSVTLYVATDGGDFRIITADDLQDSLDESAAELGSSQGTIAFAGTPGTIYEFLALARDRAGNREVPSYLDPQSGSASNYVAVPDTIAPDGSRELPADGAEVNFDLPRVGGQTAEDLPIAQPTNVSPTNPVFIEALAATRTRNSSLNPPEWQTVVRPFTAESFAAGIPASGAALSALGIVQVADDEFLVSGGEGRNELYRVVGSGSLGELIAAVDDPIYDMAVDVTGGLWATTGGGPLLQLDPATGQILQAFGDGITQSLAIHPATGEIYVSTAGGIDIFDPASGRFRLHSELRVGNLAFSPEGDLWAVSWPARDQIIRYDALGRPERVLKSRLPLDSLAFGQPGSDLDGLLFVSTNDPAGIEAGKLLMIETRSLESVVVADGGTRGDNLITTDDGRVLVIQSNQIDELSLMAPPSVVATYPPADAVVVLPFGQLSVTFDRDMLITLPSLGATSESAVLNPANYVLSHSGGQTFRPGAVSYDVSTRTALLSFPPLIGGNLTLTVRHTVAASDGTMMGVDYQTSFDASADLSAGTRLDFFNSRLHRGSGLISYDVTITNVTSRPMFLPVQLSLDPLANTNGIPQNAFQDNIGRYLIDLSNQLPAGRLEPGGSITGTTVSVLLADGRRADFDHAIIADPGVNSAPRFDSEPPSRIPAGLPLRYRPDVVDPDGDTVQYVLYNGPDGMTVDSETGEVSWLPPEYISVATVSLAAVDAVGSITLQNFTVEILGGNQPPTLKSLPVQINGREGDMIRLELNAEDPDSDDLIYFANGLPPAARLDAKTGAFRWTPGALDAGTYEVQFGVGDGFGVDLKTVLIVIQDVNVAPNVARPVTRVVNEGQRLLAKIVAKDIDGDTLSYAAALLPAGATLNPTTGVFDWTPRYWQAGHYEIPIVVSDIDNGPALFMATDETASVHGFGRHETRVTLVVEVLPRNGAPQLDSIGTFQAEEGQLIVFQVAAFDPDYPESAPPQRNIDGGLVEIAEQPHLLTYSAMDCRRARNSMPKPQRFVGIRQRVTRAPTKSPSKRGMKHSPIASPSSLLSTNTMSPR